MASMPSISIRKHIRWGAEAPGENTSTLVLTSRAKNFVDVRVYNSDSRLSALPTDPNDDEAINRLEWAFAGQSKSTAAEFDGGELKKSAHSVWSHWIDSKTLSEVKDEGDMYPQDDGTVLEKGAMAHPETGLITDYEEVWEALEPSATGDDKNRFCYVLKLDLPSNQARGMVIRIGDHIEGIMRVASRITVVRWQWKRSSDEGQPTWHRTLAMGNGAIPCEALFTGGKNGSDDLQQDMKVGEVVDTGAGMKWICIEAFSF